MLLKDLYLGSILLLFEVCMNKERNKKVVKLCKFDFSISKKGYDKSEVEQFIENERLEAEKTHMQQKIRIDELKEECVRLSQEIRQYENDKNQISMSLMQASKNAENMENDVKRRYKSELDRLRLFREKWTRCYDQISEKYKFGADALNMESVAVNTEIEIQKFLNKDFSLSKGDDKSIMESEFKSNVERLTAKNFDYEEVKPGVEELLSKINDVSKLKSASSDVETIQSTTSAVAIEKHINIWD